MNNKLEMVSKLRTYFNVIEVSLEQIRLYTKKRNTTPENYHILKLFLQISFKDIHQQLLCNILNSNLFYDVMIICCSYTLINLVEVIGHFIILLGSDNIYIQANLTSFPQELFPNQEGKGLN